MVRQFDPVPGGKEEPLIPKQTICRSQHDLPEDFHCGLLLCKVPIKPISPPVIASEVYIGVEGARTLRSY